MGHFGRGRGIVDMVDKDCAFNSLGQHFDRLEFFVAEVRPRKTVH